MKHGTAAAFVYINVPVSFTVVFLLFILIVGIANGIANSFGQLTVNQAFFQAVKLLNLHAVLPDARPLLNVTLLKLTALNMAYYQ